jgi:hypothetical protein
MFFTFSVFFMILTVADTTTPGVGLGEGRIDINASFLADRANVEKLY